MLPWPSDHFQARTWDASAPPSLRFLSNDTFPVTAAGVHIDPLAGGWANLTGASPSGFTVAYMPGLSLDGSRLPRHWNVSASVAADATSLLLAVDSGARVLHWVELDHSSDRAHAGDYERATLLWAAGRLNDSTRYIVAYRDIVDDVGARIASSPGFAALRDGTPSSSPDVEASRPRFEDIFTALAAAGWARASLTLAWDFTTAGKADITGRLVAMRDDALRRATYAYTITAVTENPRRGIARQVQGTFEAPTYLNTLDAVPWSRLALGADGVPVFQGVARFNFTVAIPTSIANGSRADGGFVQYGHGLFGSQREVEDDYLSDWANEYGYVLAAVDEVGLAEPDAPLAFFFMSSNVSNFGYIPDRCHQGVLNELLATRLVTQSAFRTDPAMVYRGVPAVSADPARWHYYGNSQGGILGSVYMAATTDVARGVIGVGGGPYGLLLARSADYADMFAVLRVVYPRPIDAMALHAAIQSLWDRAEPSGYLRAISDDPLPGTPAHRVVLQHGLADAQVSWLGVRYASVSTGASMFVSNAAQGNESLAHFRAVPDATVLTVGNLAATWDFAAPPWAAPLVNLPPVNSSLDSHGSPRKQATAQAQMAEFFATGRIVNTCGGRCTGQRDAGADGGGWGWRARAAVAAARRAGQ